MKPRKRKSKVDRRMPPLFRLLPARWDPDKGTFVDTHRTVIYSDFFLCLPLVPSELYDLHTLLTLLEGMITRKEAAK